MAAVFDQGERGGLRVSVPRFALHGMGPFENCVSILADGVVASQMQCGAIGACLDFV